MEKTGKFFYGKNKRAIYKYGTKLFSTKDYGKSLTKEEELLLGIDNLNKTKAALEFELKQLRANGE